MDEVKVTNEKQAQKEYEDQQNEIDRSWYTLDEGGADIPELFNQHDEMDLYEKKQKQAGFQTSEQRNSIAQILKSQKDADSDKWIGQQLMQSGVVERTNFDEDFDTDIGHKCHVIVHNIVPPFLDGHNIFSKQFAPVVL